VHLLVIKKKKNVFTAECLYIIRIDFCLECVNLVGLVPILWSCLLSHWTLLATFRCVCSLLSLLFRIYRAAYPGVKQRQVEADTAAALFMWVCWHAVGIPVLCYMTLTFGTVVTKALWPFPVQVESRASELLCNSHLMAPGASVWHSGRLDFISLGTGC
jgi:hypothetical protein